MPGGACKMREALSMHVAACPNPAPKREGAAFYSNILE